MSNDTISRKEAIRAVMRAPSYSDVSGEQYRKVEDVIDILESLSNAQNQEESEQMKLWAVWGYDDIFGGLHGMKEVGIFEGDENEAVQYGYELADSVISSYSQIYDALEDSVREICEDEKIEMGTDSEEESDIRYEVYKDDMVYGCVELDTSKLPTLDINELDKLYSNDEEEFIEMYRLN